jgi:phosphonate transport system substrate-binding protein
VKDLRFTSIQAPNQDFLIQSLCSYVGRKLGVPTMAVLDIPWGERERRLDRGEIQLGWICGLPYIRKADQREAAIELLAAPVMEAPRYGDKPVYFSDVIVRGDDPAQRFEDLRGRRWAFNEPNSHSGHNVVRYHLASIGAHEGFFGSVTQAGSHQEAIALVASGRVDAAAIDSTVLEIDRRKDPAGTAGLRVIETLGPSPIPPLVVRKDVDSALRTTLRELLLGIHREPGPPDFLARAGVARFVAVEDRDYDPIRDMARLAKRVQL